MIVESAGELLLKRVVLILLRLPIAQPIERQAVRQILRLPLHAHNIALSAKTAWLVRVQRESVVLEGGRHCGATGGRLMQVMGRVGTLGGLERVFGVLSTFKFVFVLPKNVLLRLAVLESLDLDHPALVPG